MVAGQVDCNFALCLFSFEKEVAVHPFEGHVSCFE